MRKCALCPYEGDYVVELRHENKTLQLCYVCSNKGNEGIIRLLGNVKGEAREVYKTTPQYQTLRRIAWAALPHVCAHCGRSLTEEQAQLNHKDYRHLFNETLDDVEFVCCECHVGPDAPLERAFTGVEIVDKPFVPTRYQTVGYVKTFQPMENKGPAWVKLRWAYEDDRRADDDTPDIYNLNSAHPRGLLTKLARLAGVQEDLFDEPDLEIDSWRLKEGMMKQLRERFGIIGGPVMMFDISVYNKLRTKHDRQEVFWDVDPIQARSR